MAGSIGTGGRYATNGVTLKFDGRGLLSLSRDLMGAAEALRADARVTLVRIGEPIVRDAQAIAAQNGSTSIPASIYGQLADGGLSYRVRAGGPSAPLAGLWELGNKSSNRDVSGRARNSRGRFVSGGSTFTHPVYGNQDEQVEQPRYPFLAPALKKNRYVITRELYRMWDRVLTPFRLRPEDAASAAESVGDAAIAGTMIRL